MNNLNKIALEPEIKNALYPFWVFTNQLDKTTCNKIIDLGKKKWVEATIHNREDYREVLVDTSKRISDIFFTNEQWLYDIAWKYLHLANQNSNWDFQIDSCEAMQITRYKKNGHYDFHFDGNGFTRSQVENKFIKNKTRKLSMTIVLNDDYEGGEFEFLNDKNLIKQKTGTIIVFPSYIVHKVKPVTKGTRYSLVVWFCGEPFK